MFSGSQFDGSSGFSGGGFVSTQPSQAFDSTPSFAKNRDFQGLVPITVKQISEASQSGGEKSGFVICGVEVSNVTLVGIVVSKDDSKFTEVRFALDDGTGRVECRRWLNEPFETKEMEAVQDGMYVRLSGHLKSFQGKKHLLVFSARPIADFNEVTFHYIECIHFFVQQSKAQEVGGITQSHMESSFHTPLRGASTEHQTAPSNNAPAQHNSDGRKNWDELILDYLKQPSSIDRQQGIHLEEISRHMKIPMDKLQDCIHSLESDGLIYSTIDESHFKHVEG